MEGIPWVSTHAGQNREFCVSARGCLPGTVRYIDQICTSTWVTFKMIQYDDDTWMNSSWEEFHHWTKLSALGVTDDEIAPVINQFRDLGLCIFSNVDISTWCSYMVWYSPDIINHLDVDKDAKAGETHEVPNFSASKYTDLSVFLLNSDQ